MKSITRMGKEQDGKRAGLETCWHENGRKKHTRHYKNGKENGVRTEWSEDGKKTFQANFIDGNEE